MPRVSFIIPVLNEEAVVASLLRQLRQAFPEAELLVVDGGSHDGTIGQAQPLCDQLLESAPGRARQMNIGGRYASGDYLLFLHADSSPGVTSEALQAHLDKVPSWGFCRVRLSGSSFAFSVIGWFMNLRSRLTRVATGDQMLFLHSDIFEESGGFDDIPLMEDVAYCKRLRKLAAPLVIPEAVLTSSRRWQEQGLIRTILRMWLLRLGYFFGVSPQRLWQNYYGEH